MFWWNLKARIFENNEKPLVFQWFLLIFTKSPYLQKTQKIIEKSFQNVHKIDEKSMICLKKSIPNAKKRPRRAKNS